MTLSDSALSVVSLVSLGLALVAVAVALTRRPRPRRPETDPSLPLPERLEAMVSANGKSIQRLEGAVRHLGGEQRRLAESLQGAVQQVGLVRFDAFEDMGGRLSFSAAFLDARGDGLVVTSIHGRQDTRSYAKRVEGGTSIHNLTDEEEQAIREALGASRQTVEAR